MRALSAKRLGRDKMGGDPSHTISLGPLSPHTCWIKRVLLSVESLFELVEL